MMLDGGAWSIDRDTAVLPDVVVVCDWLKAELLSGEIDDSVPEQVEVA